jgi:hypothetical protein
MGRDPTYYHPTSCDCRGCRANHAADEAWGKFWGFLSDDEKEERAAQEEYKKKQELLKKINSKDPFVRNSVLSREQYYTKLKEVENHSYIAETKETLEARLDQLTDVTKKLEEIRKNIYQEKKSFIKYFFRWNTQEEKELVDKIYNLKKMVERNLYNLTIFYKEHGFWLYSNWNWDYNLSKYTYAVTNSLIKKTLLAYQIRDNKWAF